MSGEPPRGPPEDRPEREPPAERGPPDTPGGVRRDQPFDARLDRIRKALERGTRDRLEALPNVVGVGLGERRCAGERTGEPAVRVHVDQKRPLSKLPKKAIIPETVTVGVEEVQTDVIESGGRFTPDSATWGGTAAPNRDARIRPMPGGVQIGVDGRPASSTALVRYNSRPAVIMARHAVADGRVDPTGNTVYSPARQTSRTRIGEVVASAPWYSGTQRTQADAVIVDVDIGSDGKPVVSTEYLPPVQPREVAYSPNRERNAIQIASSTGIEGAPITDTDFSTTVDYEFGSVRYEGLVVAGLPGEPGSSGAAVIQRDVQGTLSMVGIHMGSSPDRALIIPWQNLEDVFGGDLRLP